MTITDTQHQASSPEAAESTYEGSMGSPAKAGKGLWIAILALGAVIALALAAALGAFDGSSGSDGTAVEFVDPRLDSDFHRTPYVSSGLNTPAAAAASVAAMDPRADADHHREPPAPAASVVVNQPTHPQAWEELVSGSAVAQPTHPQAWEERVSDVTYDQVDPRLDSDFHREP